MKRSQALLVARQLARETGDRYVVRRGTVVRYDPQDERRGDIVVYFRKEK